MKRLIAELLDQLNLLDEGARIEAKRGLGKEALHTISAFANEPGLDGGTLVFGVVAKGANGGGREGYEVVGVSDPDKLQSDLASQCAATFNRPLRPTIWSEPIEGRVVVAAYIDEAPAGEKPIYLKSSGMPGGAYRRIGASDVRCSDDDLRLFHTLAQEGWYEDSFALDGAMADLDDEVIEDYRKVLVEQNPDTAIKGYDRDRFVQALGGARPDGTTLRPTVAGLVLFAKRPALRRLFPGLRVDYVRVNGTRWVTDPDRRFQSVDVLDPLLVTFRRIYAAVMDDLPKQFYLPPGTPSRQEIPALPEKAVREAIVNALVHRNYHSSRPTQVIRYTDRLEVQNAGHSLVEEENFGRPGSLPRNPKLVSVFRDLGFAEGKGTGIDVMRQAMKAAKLTPPTFESQRSSDLFSATFFLHNLLGAEQLAWLAQWKGLGLTDAQAQALVYARSAGHITNANLRDLAGLETLEASAELRRLRDHGLLELRGAGAAAQWVLADAEGRAAFGDATTHGGQQELPLSQGPERHATGAASPETQGFPGKTQGFESQTQGLPPKAQESEGDGLLLPEALLLAAKALGKRPPLEELRRVVRKFCAFKPMTPTELAWNLGKKDVANFVRSHITPMLEAGELERTHPENPAHPRQAYRTTALGREKP
jgi:ATP-dependent DNA helicase RecG